MNNNNKRKDPNDLQSREAVIDRLKIGGLTVVLMFVCFYLSARATTLRPLIGFMVAGVLYLMTMMSLTFENFNKQSDDDDNDGNKRDDKGSASGKR